jgi:hypothetical protein
MDKGQRGLIAVTQLLLLQLFKLFNNIYAVAILH